MARTRALLEVLTVLAAAVAAVALVARSPAGRWGREALGYPCLEYLALGLVALAAIAVDRRPLAAYGLVRRRLAEQLDTGLRCALPYAAGKALLFPLGPRQAIHSLVEPVVVLGVVVAWAWLLRPRSPGLTAGLLLALAFLPQPQLAALLFYPLLLAPAEELLFRGYIQGRLDAAFRRRVELLGARVGASLWLTAGLFALFHLINVPALVEGRLAPLWFLIVPTFAWGVALGYLRARSGSLVPPALCHGVPQAIAVALFGR
ncbi:MAG TPA: CPBP family intramembrane glutamic endopeptidase [Thermoanaerobaculia bacterium]|nr:CPBP family intramembrane glutamic endopeptidase [Thermoanaerobaculia bacterium]